MRAKQPPLNLDTTIRKELMALASITDDTVFAETVRVMCHRYMDDLDREELYLLIGLCCGRLGGNPRVPPGRKTEPKH